MDKSPSADLMGISGRASALGCGDTMVSEAPVDDAVTANLTVRLVDPHTRQPRDIDIKPRSTRLTSALEDADLADFTLGPVIGRGGMGVVYRAYQRSLVRTVAIKMVRTDVGTALRENRKFVTEAVLAGQLDHPNIVPLYELGVTDDGRIFYVMKEIQGLPWSRSLTTLSEVENLGILQRVADATAFAHHRGIIHRDLKPGNVILGDFGEVMLADWGLALSHLPDANGQPPDINLAGTPAYMAPEMAQAENGKIGPASDLYLLGAILYEIATGHPPHTGQNAVACIINAANNVIVPTDRDDELVDIARTAMATRPEDRYAGVKEFQNRLKEYAKHSESLLLTRRARTHLEQARRTGSLEDYNRAIFIFGEALALWSGNKAANDGEQEARIDHVEQALNDYDRSLAAAALTGDKSPPRP